MQIIKSTCLIFTLNGFNPAAFIFSGNCFIGISCAVCILMTWLLNLFISSVTSFSSRSCSSNSFWFLSCITSASIGLCPLLPCITAALRGPSIYLVGTGGDLITKISSMGLFSLSKS